MPDMLIKLYDLADEWGFIAEQKNRGVAIRKPIGPEKHPAVKWVAGHFSPGWAAETDVAFSNTPRSCFAAVKAAKFIGFACYDATALGYFGPIGVEKSERGQGIGQALLKACLLDMKLKGYGEFPDSFGSCSLKLDPDWHILPQIGCYGKKGY